MCRNVGDGVVVRLSVRVSVWVRMRVENWHGGWVKGGNWLAESWQKLTVGGENTVE